MNETAPNCRQCNQKLKPYIYFGDPDIDPNGRRKWGYDGDNLFCTLRCGYRWALDLLKRRS